MFLPSIMRRIDDFLVVKELNAKFFDHAVKEDLLHVAVCTPSAAIEYDYERLELLGGYFISLCYLHFSYNTITLGDAFLKYLSSVYAFVTNPSLSEGALHFARQKIISNKSLLQNATRIGLPTYIQSKAFAFKSWQPPHFQVHIPSNIQKDTKSPIISEGIDMLNNDSSILDADLDTIQALDEFSNEVEDIVPIVLEPGELVETTSMNSPISPTIVPPGGEQPQSTPEIKGLISKKKQKGKRKKIGSDERTVQWLGDKV
jgi:endoribonuclease Dicer